MSKATELLNVLEEKTSMICRECGKKFKKTLGKKTVEVKCPKCGGYDTDVDEKLIELFMVESPAEFAEIEAQLANIKDKAALSKWWSDLTFSQVSDTLWNKADPKEQKAILTLVRKKNKKLGG